MKKNSEILISCVVFALLMLLGCGEPLSTGSVTQGLCEDIEHGGNGCCPGSPIILDLAGDGIHLTGPSDGVLFTLRPGVLGLWSWTPEESDDSFLTIDLNHNGHIDSGAEMFGDGSPQIANGPPNGFNALAFYDLASEGGNEDGRIDSQDDVWSRLMLWRDANHDALSQAGELISLTTAHVHSLSTVPVVSQHVDENGNEFRFVATIVADAPTARVASDVWLQQISVPEEPESVLTTYYKCTSWIYAVQAGGANACNVQAVQDDPIISIVNNGVPRFTRRVSRSIESTSRTGAKNASIQAVLFDVIGAPGEASCGAAPFPNPDNYRAPPYEEPQIGDVRTQCVTLPPPTGGSC